MDKQIPLTKADMDIILSYLRQSTDTTGNSIPQEMIVFMLDKFDIPEDKKEEFRRCITLVQDKKMPKQKQLPVSLKEVSKRPENKVAIQKFARYEKLLKKAQPIAKQEKLDALCACIKPASNKGPYNPKKDIDTRLKQLEQILDLPDEETPSKIFLKPTKDQLSLISSFLSYVLDGNNPELTSGKLVLFLKENVGGLESSKEQKQYLADMNAIRLQELPPALSPVPTVSQPILPEPKLVEPTPFDSKVIEPNKVIRYLSTTLSLIGQKIKYGSIWNVVHDGNVDVLKQKIENGANVNARNDLGGYVEGFPYIQMGDTCLTSFKTTILHYAALKKQYECMKVLLRSGADVNATKRVKKKDMTPFSSDRYNDLITVLHWAVQEGDVTCMKILLEHGADVNLGADADARRRDGVNARRSARRKGKVQSTALHSAVQNKDAHV
jgi:hypothetical protein